MMSFRRDCGNPGNWFRRGIVGSDQAKLVRAGKNGEPITDGVFPESKEFLAGYWIVDVDTPERAYRDRGQGVGSPGTRGMHH